MSDAELPVVGEDLTRALSGAGTGGLRALGLLRDARAILVGEVTLEQPAEVAASCLRGALDAMLKLPGAPKKGPRLNSVAAGLLDAVDAVPSGDDRPGARGVGWERVESAAEVLREVLATSSGWHQAHARAVAQHHLQVEPGTAQERALAVWSRIYDETSRPLHGADISLDKAKALYREVGDAATELLVPLIDRAAAVLQLAEVTNPDAQAADQLAGALDPRVADYFFTARPVPGWLAVLEAHAGHLLLPDTVTGRWTAAPFLDQLAQTEPGTARAWLAGHAQQVAAAGLPAAGEVMLLAVRHPRSVPAAQIRAVVSSVTGSQASGVQDALERQPVLRLAAQWALEVPVADRDRDWVIVVELLVAGAVEAEHADRRAAMERVRRAAAPPALATGAGTGEQAPDAGGVEAGEAPEDVERRAEAARMAARLSEQTASALLEALAATLADGPHPCAAMIRKGAAARLCRALDALEPWERTTLFHGDLADPGGHNPSLSMALARTVLQVAAAEATAGTGWAQRLDTWGRIATADAALYARLLAAHLAHAAPPPAEPKLEDGREWWERAVELIPALAGDRPSPEAARLVDQALRTCPPERTQELDAAVRAGLPPVPAPQEVDQVLPADAERVDGLAEPLASWLRVWDWSPVLPGRLLTGWTQVLERLRRLAPEGPADPRTASDFQVADHVPGLPADALAATVTGQGPAAAAARIAAAEDADHSGYALVLRELADQDPAAWTADVPGVLAALDRPALKAFYLAAAAACAGRPGAFANGWEPAVTAGLRLRENTDRHTPQDPVVLDAVDRAVTDLLSAAWRTGADLGAAEPAALAHLGLLARPLTVPPTEPSPGTEPEPGIGTALRALQALLDHAAAQVRAGGDLPDSILELLDLVLAARADDESVATAVGLRLPLLHLHAPAWTAAHRAALLTFDDDRPSPAAAWLRFGRFWPPLLADLDRAALFEAVRAGRPRALEHLAAAVLSEGAAFADPGPLLAELADGTGGAAAVSRLLAQAAGLLPRSLPGPDADPAAAAEADRAAAAATGLWHAALDADLPPAALAGTGAFATTTLDDQTWLHLTRASAEAAPALEDAELAAERAAAHPESPDAVHLAARLVAQRQDLWTDLTVRRHARALLEAAAALPEDQRPDGVEELREALVNAGDLPAART